MILGFGELTMNSYERGTLPDPPNRLLLKLAENPIHFRAMYQVNSSRIGALQRQRIEASEGYRSATSWQGLEALGIALTHVQREKVEAVRRRSRADGSSAERGVGKRGIVHRLFEVGVEL